MPGGNLRAVGLLDGKRILITGVLTDASLAFAVARPAQEEGAEVVLSRRRTRPLAHPAHGPQAPDRGRGPRDRRHRRPTSSQAAGAALAAAVGPARRPARTPSASRRPTASAATCSRPTGTQVQVGAPRLDLLAQGPRRGLPAAAGGGRRGRPARASVVGLDFDATVAWPVYDWMGVAKAALESLSRYLATGPRARRHPGQPGGGRPGQDHGGQVHPGLHRLRGHLGRPGAARLGRPRRRRRWPRPASPSSATSSP